MYHLISQSFFSAHYEIWKLAISMPIVVIFRKVKLPEWEGSFLFFFSNNFMHIVQSHIIEYIYIFNFKLTQKAYF